MNNTPNRAFPTIVTPSKQLKDGVKKRLNNKNYDYANDAEMQNFYAKNY